MNAPFLMAIQTMKGAVVEGIIRQGTVSTGDTVQVVDADHKSQQAQIADIARSADNHARVTLTGMNREFKDGWMIAPPNAIALHKHIRADVTFLQLEEGGRKTPLVLVRGYTSPPGHTYETLRLQIHGVSYRCIPAFPHPDMFDYLEASPGDLLKLNITLWTDIPVKIGNEFELLDGHVIATGIVTDLLD